MNRNRLSPRVTSAEFQVAYWPSGQPRPASSSFRLHRCSPSVQKSPGPTSCNTQHVNYTIILMIKLKWYNLVEEASAKKCKRVHVKKEWFICPLAHEYSDPCILRVSVTTEIWLSSSLGPEALICCLCPPYLPFTHGFIHLLMSGTTVSKWVPSSSKTSHIRIEANSQRK